MAMKTYFVSGLSAEAARKAADSGLLVSEKFTIDNDIGILIDSGDLAKLLALIKAKKISEGRSPYEGVYYLYLSLNDELAEQPVAPPPAKADWPEITFEPRDWEGIKDQRYLDAVKTILVPALPGKKVAKIKIYSQRNNLITLENYREQETTFRIFLGGWSQKYQEEVITPEKLWGIPVAHRSQRAHLTYSGMAISDPSGHIAAELHGNNLIIFHFINSSGDKTEADIFEKILQAAAAALTAPPEAGTRTLYQLMSAVRTDGEGNVKLFMKSTALTLVQNYDKVKTVTLHGHGGVVELASYQDKEGEFHIFFTSGCVNGGKRKSPEKIFDIDVVCRNEAWPISTDGVPIADEKTDYDVAEIMGNNLFICHHLDHDASSPAIRLYEWILDEALKQWQKPLEQLAAEKAERDHRRHAKNREAYVGLCEAKIKERVAAAQKQAANLRASAGQWYAQCIEQMREADDLAARAQGLEAQEQALAATLRAEYDQLASLPKVLAVAIEKSAIIAVLTHTLCCDNPHKRKAHQIGKFKILINAGTGDVRCINMTGQIQINGQAFNAPRVDADGRIMAGDVGAAMVELVGQYEFVAVTDMAVQFIETVGDDEESRRRLEKWPVE